MKTFLKNALDLLVRFFQFIWKIVRSVFRKYPELLSVPIAFFVWIVSIPLLRWMDPTSAVYDAGVFQVLIFAVLQLFVYVSIAWLILGLVFGTARKFLLNEFKDAFNTLEGWKKIIVSYGLFLSLLFSLVALSYTLH